MRPCPRERALSISHSSSNRANISRDAFPDTTGRERGAMNRGSRGVNVPRLSAFFTFALAMSCASGGTAPARATHRANPSHTSAAATATAPRSSASVPVNGSAVPKTISRVSRAPGFKSCLRGDAHSNELDSYQFAISADGARIAVVCGLTRLDIIEVAAPERVWLSLEMSRIDLGHPAVGFRKDGVRLFLFGSADMSARPAPLVLDLEAATVSKIPHEELAQARTFWPSDDWSRVLLQRQDGALMLLDGFAGAELGNVPATGPLEEINDARFSPDGARLAVATDQGLALRDGATGALHSVLDKTSYLTAWQGITWSRDGGLIFARRSVAQQRPPARMSPGESLYEVVEFDAATGRRRGRWSGKDVLASVSGRFVYVVPDARRIQRVERATGKVKLLLQNTDEGYAWAPQLLAASPDDRLLFTRVSTPGGSSTFALDASNGGTQPGW